MHYLVATLYLLFSVLGWDGFGAHSIATYVTVQGADVLSSETRITPLFAQFSCVDSVSGSCHYRLYLDPCEASSRRRSDAPCKPGPPRELLVLRGEHVELDGLPDDFSFCVDQQAMPRGASCAFRQHVSARF